MKKVYIFASILFFIFSIFSFGAKSNKSAATIANKNKPPEVIKPVIPGIKDAFQTPFLYVYGTQSNDSMENRVLKRTVEDTIRFWKIGRGREEQYKADTEITLSDISSYHLILYGSPVSNKIITQIYKQLPIQIEADGVIAGGKKYTNDGVGVIMIHPNPLYPKKYVVVFWGSNHRAIRWINSVPYGKTDYVIFDERSFLLQKTEQPEPPVIEKGFFDKTDPLHWKYIPPPAVQPAPVTPSVPPIRSETSFDLHEPR